MHLVRFIRVGLLFSGLYASFVSGVELNCTSYYNNVPSDEFSFQLSKDDLSSKNCSYTSKDPGPLQVPTIRITNIQLTGKNTIQIWQTSDIGGVQYFTTITSSNFRNMSISMDPGYLYFQFNILENTKNDFFDIQTTFTNLTTNSSFLSSLPFENPSEFVNSLAFPPNNSVFLPDGAFNMQIFVFDKTFDVNLLKKYYVYSGMLDLQFRGTLYDIWKTSQSGGSVYVRQISVLNLGPTVTDAFSVFLLKNSPVFPTFFQLLSEASVVENMSSVNSPKVIYEVVGPRDNVSIPTNFHNINVTGPGSVAIYAGCAVFNYEKELIGIIGAQNQSDFENLSIHGECRTYLLKNVEVTWQKTRGVEPNQPTKRGQHGVIMSNMYPRTENMSYTMVKSIEYPEDADSFSVTYVVIASDSDVFVEVDQKTQKLPNFEKITYSSTGAQIVNVDIWPYQTGTFVWYTVNSSMVFTSFLSISILIVINFIRI